jgi:nucleoid-associated protein YgaU
MASIKSPYDSVVIVEYPDDSISLESTKETIITTDDDLIYTVKDGDTLQGIANVYYKDSGLWHIIALANDIQNPFDENEFYPGQILKIPQYGGN